MKRELSIIIAAVLMLSTVLYGGRKESKISGRISGAHCGVNGMACAATHDLRRAELPGIYTKDNKFYLLTNVPQTFLAQWPFQEATVEGTVYEREKAVDAKKVTIKDGDNWRAVFEDGNIIDDMGHKEKLASAMEIDGKWYCANCAVMHGKK